MRIIIGLIGAAAAVLGAGTAHADGSVGVGGGIPGVPGAPGSEGGGGELSPGSAAAIFLCPGVGAAVNVLGVGGGYCDFDFKPNNMGHSHCEWGGARIIQIWNCWRVFPGQPDHPAHPDPDIIPDGFGVPWALLGPTVNDQWPPPGLAPAPPPPPDDAVAAPPAPPGADR